MFLGMVALFCAVAARAADNESDDLKVSGGGTIPAPAKGYKWQKVREWLMEGMRIVALFDLPSNVFAETGVNTSILVAYKPKAAELAYRQIEEEQRVVRYLRITWVEFDRVNVPVCVQSERDHKAAIDVGTIGGRYQRL